MKEFTKISNIFTMDTKGKITGLQPLFQTLRNVQWEGTEKVDGTNIRIHWDGHSVEIGGRTDKAQIPTDLYNMLAECFLSKPMEYKFEEIFGEKDVILFGEGYGPKIQNGGTYASEPKFILFDVLVDGKFYLTRANVNDVADKMELDRVPIVFYGTIDDAIKCVAQHPMSLLGEHKHEMEGLVLQPVGIMLYDANGHPIKGKCKYRDICKTENLEDLIK